MLSTYNPKINSKPIMDIFNDSKIKPVNGIIINNKQTDKYEHLLNKLIFFHFVIIFFNKAPPTVYFYGKNGIRIGY